MQFNTLILFTYGFLYLAIIALWVPSSLKFLIPSILLSLAILFGLIVHIIKPIALIPIILLPLSIYCSQIKTLKTGIKFFAYLLIIVLSLGLMSHLFAGFYNLKVIDQVYISKDAIPYTLYLNFDKALVGLFILGMTHCLLSKKEWITLIKQILFPMLVLICLIMLAAIFLGFVHFDPKIPDSFLIWAVTNFLFVSVAEEAFFRGFLQKNLSCLLNKMTYGNYIAITIVAVLFGMLHYAGGIRYIVLATAAGIGYGWIYDRTKHIESAVITHFSLDLIHFIFFTYPMLASAV